MIIVICLISVALLAGLDQLFKYMAVSNIAEGEIVKVLSAGEWDILKFTFYKNSGAAFSSLQGKIPFLIAVTVVMMGLLVFYLIKYKPESRFAVVCIVMIIGGGIGNLIDRILLGYVVDFLILWPFTFIFNFADICVVIGAILLMIYIIFFDKSEEKKQETAEAKNE
ncbi:MAG: signal peptidase II [Oscillospiraceae bacterium]|nr:signal peptidase II [Oscillospiraceae bacterium]